MITESQKIKFKENLDSFFNVINKDVNGEPVEKMFVTEVGKRDYQIEIYNRGKQYSK